MWIYHPQTGAINAFLKLIGLGSLARGWLGDPNTALSALATISPRNTAWIGKHHECRRIGLSL